MNPTKFLTCSCIVLALILCSGPGPSDSMIMLDPVTLMMKMMKAMMMMRMMGLDGGYNNSPTEGSVQASPFESINMIINLAQQMFQQFATVTSAIPTFMAALTGQQPYKRESPSPSPGSYAAQASTSNEATADPMQNSASENFPIYQETYQIEQPINKSESLEERNATETTAPSGQILDPIFDEYVFRQFFEFLSSFDRDSCLQKLMCDIHARADSAQSHTAYEKGVLKMFRLIRKYRQEKPNFLSGDKYIQAAQQGTDVRSTVLCKLTYSTCKYTANEIMMGRGIYV